jgi:tRNA A64-2'-O-ribosylphosphate transferase
MRIAWQRPGDALPSAPTDESDSNLVVLCTASNQTSTQTSSTSDYVQGAADDPESWSLGLDAAMFWSRQTLLTQASEDELPDLIQTAVEEARLSVATREVSRIEPTSNLYIGDNAAVNAVGASFDVIISCVEKSEIPVSSDATDSGVVQHLHLACGAGKVGSRQLRRELAKLEPLLSMVNPTIKILVTCQTGKDLAVGVALMLLCRMFDENGSLAGTSLPRALNKTVIKQRLSWIMVSMPDASPSRATLQSVNAYLT